MFVAVSIFAASNGATNAASALAHARQVLIVPLETPPIGFDFASETRMAADALNLNAEGASGDAPAPIVVAGAPVAAVTSVVSAIGTASAAKNNTDLTMSIVSALSAGGTWVPSRVVAGLVASELEKRGITAVRVREGVEPIPGVTDRRTTMSMHNWWGPLNSYYREAKTPFSYLPPDVDGQDVVMEVSLVPYEYLYGALNLGVHLKLVAPTSGAVISRGDKRIRRAVGKASEAFANGGEKYKAGFESLAQEATIEALKDLGL